MKEGILMRDALASSIENPRVRGLIPSPGTIQHKALHCCRAFLLCVSGRNLAASGLPEHRTENPRSATQMFL